jgi:hypothetical protein
LRLMSRLLPVVLLFIALTIPSATAHYGDEEPVFAQINSIVKSLSEITGWPEKHPVPYGRMSKRQLRQFLVKRIKKTLRPEEIHADELALKMFGLVPRDFDLKKSTIDLLTEQAAAFYDYDEKKLFLLENSSFDAEVTTLAHELSHALADQYYDLDKFMDEDPANDDENLARTAVVEGQASWLMLAYDLKLAGRPAVPTPEALAAVVDASDTTSADYPVLKASPLYIQQSLLFPYTDGTMFFNAVYKRDGKKAFSEVFTDAPKDSAQIIHPARYFAHETAAIPALPKLASQDKEEEVSEGSVGEFDHEMLLWQYGSRAKAKELAPHLRGGSFKIVTEGRERKPVLTYASEWDSREQAQEFFGLYKKVLRTKWQYCDVRADRDAVFAGQSDSGYFVAKLSGNTITSIEGLSDAGEWERLKDDKVAVALRLSFSQRVKLRSWSTIH